MLQSAAEITGNEATNGGGVFAGSGDVEIGGSAKVSGNEARNGGGVFAGSGDVEIGGNAKVSGNEATNGGGGLHVDSGNVTISGNAQITGNEATYGGGLYVDSGNVTISGNAQITGNEATYGGGLYVDSGDVTIGGNVKITGNEALHGGGLFADTDYVKVDITINGGEISRNEALNGGGLFADTGNVTISGGEISRNEALNGGGLFADTGNVKVDITINGGEISRNEATYGGGLFARGDITINGGEISRNEALNGGGLFADTGNVTISGGEISRNEALNGGGLYARGDVTISGNAQISNNTTGGDGGGLWARGDVTISGNAQISGNTAGCDGGGVWAGNINNITVTGGIFKGNVAGSGGYRITDVDKTSAPYKDWAGYTFVSEPFTHIANNFDIVYTPSSETPVHVAVFSMNDGSYEDFRRIEITRPGNPLDNFPEAPVRDGFNFTGWNENADGSGGSVTGNYPFTATRRVYAQWEIPPVNPEVPKPPFAGPDDDWDNDDSGGINYVTIKFNTGGGSTVKSIFTAVNTTLKLPADPVREGYIFTGWYTDMALVKPFIPDMVISHGITLYAGWELIEDGAVTEKESESLIDADWQNPFADIHESDWYYRDAAYVHKNGLMTGISREQFSPGSPVTRGMAAAILWRLSGSPSPEGTPAFADLSQDWYRDAVVWANEAGIAAGYGNNLFAPEDTITREQLGVMLYNYARYAEPDINVYGDLSGYTDGSDISGYALEAMAWANGKGYISGRSQRELAPKGITTRAEIAAIIHRFKVDMTGE